MEKNGKIGSGVGGGGGGGGGGGREQGTSHLHFSYVSSARHLLAIFSSFRPNAEPVHML